MSSFSDPFEALFALHTAGAGAYPPIKAFQSQDVADRLEVNNVR
jgi:hypothetical protein